MRTPLLAPMLALALAGCATMQAAPDLPEGAVENTRTEANGDVVTEYRVGTQLRMSRWNRPTGRPTTSTTATATASSTRTTARR